MAQMANAPHPSPPPSRPVEQMLFIATTPLASSASRAFTRYAFAVQYHGEQFLGFTYQGRRGENCIVYRKDDGTVEADLRGVESVEGRIRRALDRLVGRDNYTNIQVSSRTDRGVHAMRNTFQVDIRPRLPAASDGETPPDPGGEKRETQRRPVKQWCPKNLMCGLNFHLFRLPRYIVDEDDDIIDKESDADASQDDTSNSDPPANRGISILSCAKAPTSLSKEGFPWDVRYTATRRAYAYRILYSYDVVSEEGDGESQAIDATYYHNMPFEHDRVWRIHRKAGRGNASGDVPLDISAMKRAGAHLVGTHDFTSFRGSGCERFSPIVTLEDVWISKDRYIGNGALSGVHEGKSATAPNEEESSSNKENETRQWLLSPRNSPDNIHLITIVITGKQFLYHQVRNIVAVLVDVGRGRLTPDDVKNILENRDRSCCATSGMAPAKGLFLLDVEHGGFRF